MTYIDPPSKLLYHLDRVAQIEAGGHPAPVNVECDLSNRCNLGCLGCHMAYTHSRGFHASKRLPAGVGETGDLMKTGLAIDIMRQLNASGVRSITWTGGGEPLMHPDALDIFANCPIEQGLYTNATLIDPQKAAVIKRVMRWVYVSLDRHTRESYQDYKQANLFDRAIEGIKALVSASGQATVGIGFLLDETNYRDYSAMIALGRDLGAGYVQFRPKVETGASQGIVAGNREWITDFLGKYSDAGEDAIVDFSRFAMYRDWDGHGYPFCHWAQLQAVITPDGRAWTCVNRRGFEGDCLGDLNNEPFEAIWKRSGICRVNENCRVWCRGHWPNMQLNKILGEKQPHWRFI